MKLRNGIRIRRELATRKPPHAQSAAVRGRFSAVTSKAPEMALEPPEDLQYCCLCVIDYKSGHIKYNQVQYAISSGPAQITGLRGIWIVPLCYAHFAEEASIIPIGPAGLVKP